MFAAAQVGPPSADTGRIPALVGRAAGLRDLLLTTAVALSRAGLLPAAAVARIQAGRGPRDAAGDCIDLASLFEQNAAAIAGKHAVLPEQIAACAAAGDELVRVLRPARARPGPRSDREAAENRDRLWTLLGQRHAELRRAGFWLFGEQEIDRLVPTLQARAGRPRKAAATTPPA